MASPVGGLSIEDVALALDISSGHCEARVVIGTRLVIRSNEQQRLT
jgi:hypothetical protein